MHAAPPPESCSYRRVPPSEAVGGTAICGLIERLADQHRAIDARVSRQVCTACLQCPAAAPARINPVVASALYGAAAAALQKHGHSERDRAQLSFLQAYAVRHLDVAEPDGAIVGRRQDHDWCDNRGQRSSTITPSTGLPTVSRRLMRAARRFRRWPAIGLIGWNTPSGLGYQNRDIVDHLPIRRWLIPHHSRLAPLPLRWNVRRRSRQLADLPTPGEFRRSLGGLDWLMFVESPLVDGLIAAAKQAGVRVACVCNWESACPVNSDWLYHVDLLICPTQHTYRMMQVWQSRFGFAWPLLYVPWPIDAGRFRFRLRQNCRRFVFVNGWSGCRGLRADGSPAPYQRKGIELLLQAARLLPRVPFIVHSQAADLPPRPPNVELRPPSLRNSDLYREGDVCVQPSHWEGLGLPLLECQAAGMPLITTDAPPMNEHNALRTIRVCKTEDVLLRGDYPVPAQLMDPRDLAATLEGVFEIDIREASLQARRFIESEHGWAPAAALLRHALNELS